MDRQASDGLPGIPLDAALVCIIFLAVGCTSAQPPDIREAAATAPMPATIQAQHLSTPSIWIGPAPTATVTATPRPKLDDPEVQLGLIAELGYGIPWASVWSEESDRLRVLSPAGMLVLSKASGEWEEVDRVAAIMSDAIRRSGGLGSQAFDMNLCTRPGMGTLVGISPAGSILAYQDGESRLKAWDLAKAEPLSESDPLPYISDIQVSADGLIIAVHQAGRGVHLFDTLTGEQLGSLVDRNATAMALSFTEGEAITISEFHVQRWDLDTRRVLSIWNGSFPKHPALAVLHAGVVTLADWQGLWSLQPDGDAIQSDHGFPRLGLAYGSVSGSSYVFHDPYGVDYPEGVPHSLAQLAADDMRVENQIDLPVPLYDLQFAENDRHLAAITCYGQILEIDLGSGKVDSLPEILFSNCISDLAFSHDGTILAVASPGWPVRLWHTGTLELMAEVTPGGNLVQFDPGDAILGIASEDRVWLWDLEQEIVKWKFVIPFPPNQFNFPLEGFRITSNGRVVVSDRENLYSLEADSGELQWQVNYGQGRYAQVLFSPGGDVVLVGSADYTTDVRDTLTGAFLRSFIGPVPIIAISPDLREGVASGGDKVHMQSLESGETLRSFEVPLQAVTAAYSEDGTLLALGGRNSSILNNNVVVLTLPLRKQIRAVLEGQTGLVSAIAISPNGDLVATGATDGTIRLWGSVP